MKLIIDISENIYNTIMQDVMPNEGQMSAIVTRIYHGTPYEERSQGEWITVYFNREELNVSQKASMFDFVKCPFCETIHQGRHHFCSWCGADMRGDNNEKDNL